MFMFSFADFFGDDIELEGGNPVFTVAHRTSFATESFAGMSSSPPVENDV